MKGIWLQDGQLELKHDLPAPRIREGELLVDVVLAGICGTDLELLSGYAGFRGIPGHEFVGKVVDGPDEWRGRRIVASINIGCGQCDACLGGDPGHCSRREVIGIRERAGAFAEQLTLPIANALPVPDELDDRQAVLVEPLAAALEILSQVDVDRAGRVLVIGAGRLGQLVTQVLASRAAKVDVLVRNEVRAAAFAPLNVSVIREAPTGYDLVVECSGNPAGMAAAIASVRPRGTVVLKSTLAGPPATSLNDIVINEITLVGSRCGPFDQAIEFIRSGKLETAHLAFENYRLEDFEQAIVRARSPEVYKVMLGPG